MFWWRRFVAHRLQAEGTSGTDIMEFQRVLNRRARHYGIQVKETGVYDAETIAAVRSYQDIKLNLKADGFVGPLTAAKLHIQLEE